MEWRIGWEPYDPLRPCYTCGAPPSHFLDRNHSEPAYECLHDPYISSDDDPPFGTWSTRATPDEWSKAYKRATRIKEENDARGWQSKFNSGDKQLEYLARGVVAEMVAARLTGLKHDQRFLTSGYRRSSKKADIGSNVEVRNTRYHDGELALYDNDPDERIALLVTGEDPFVIRGWIRVKHGRLRKLYRKSPSPGRWLVPQEMLHPMPLPPEA